jgi:phosphate butyryltransferase
MKGLVNSSVFLKAVLNTTHGLREKDVLSHLAAFEIPGQNRLHFHSDGGMCTFPNLLQKLSITENALTALRAMGYACPKVAILSANETVNPQIPSTADAYTIQKMNESGQISGCIIEGPVAMDVALSKEAAAHKKINSRICGETDLFIVPNIEAGNLVGKTLVYAAKAKMAGVILGATVPVVMTSRSDNAEAKLNSLALACACL